MALGASKQEYAWEKPILNLSCTLIWQNQGDLFAFIVIILQHPFLNESRWKCLSSGFCYLLLQFPSVVLKASPYFIWDTKQPSLLHTPWCLLNSSNKSLGCFKCIQHFFPIIYVGDKLFLTNCLRSLRGTWFEKAPGFSSNILVARQLPTSALPELAHCEVEQSSYISSEIVFNIHMLKLLPHGFSSLKNINISNNPGKFDVAFSKSWAVLSQNRYNPRSAFIIAETSE